jgi:hypothetical protein
MIDLRRYKRVETRNELYYVCMDGKKREMYDGVGVTVNISRGGVLLETLYQVECPFMRLSTWGIYKECRQIGGRVVYCKHLGNGKFLTGVEFKAPPHECADIIATMIRCFYHSKRVPGRF